MGVTRWVSRHESSAVPEPSESVPAVAEMDLQQLRQTVAVCRRCPLHESRTQAVFGVGSPSADWMIIGEAPGAEEDRLGEPFVGRAGRLLDAMLKALEQSRETVYIANVLKCRPPNNRDPSPEEAEKCSPYLERQITLIRPRIILALGRVAAQRLLETDSPLGRMRGQVFHYGEDRTPVIVTYHPAYLLRRPGEKGKVWLDLLLAARVVEGKSQ
jgi:uracil-DNA glycosylase family 4